MEIIVTIRKMPALSVTLPLKETKLRRNSQNLRAKSHCLKTSYTLNLSEGKLANEVEKRKNRRFHKN